uniref:Uncharacterized protein n=1 Tax=Glossina austeni TaxID=7395 RepID=A0A1A9V4K6_GLOAU
MFADNSIDSQFTLKLVMISEIGLNARSHICNMHKLLNSFYNSSAVITSEFVETTQPQMLKNAFKTHRHNRKLRTFSMLVERIRANPKRVEIGDVETPLDSILETEQEQQNINDEVCLLRDSPFRILRLYSYRPNAAINFLKLTCKTLHLNCRFNDRHNVHVGWSELIFQLLQ